MIELFPKWQTTYLNIKVRLRANNEEQLNKTCLENAEECESNPSRSKRLGRISFLIFQYYGSDGCQENSDGADEFIVVCVPPARRQYSILIGVWCRLSVCGAVHCVYSKSLNKWIRSAHRNTILEFSTPTPTLSPQTSHFLNHGRWCHLANKTYLRLCYLFTCFQSKSILLHLVHDNNHDQCK